MTTATPVPTARRAGPVAHTVRRIGGEQLSLLAWFWVVVVPFVALGTLVLARLHGEVDAAVALYTRQGAIWFPFAQTVILVGVRFRVHVAAGMTRRSFARGTTLVAVGTGIGYAAVLTGLAAVERATHHALGWDWQVQDAMLADEASPAGLLLAELVLVCVAAHVSGLLVGIVYQRAGGWWGTLALPLTAGPVALVMALLSGFADVPAGRESWTAAAPWLLACLLVIAVEAAAYAAVTTRTPVRPASP